MKIQNMEFQNMEKLQKQTEQIAFKYAEKLEKRIDEAKELAGEDSRDIYEGIQMLGHIIATLERFSRMGCETVIATESHEILH